MPRYAILGGTGNIGSELIKQLFTKKDVSLHVYVRSRSRLVKAFPALTAVNSPHAIFEGTLENEEVLAACLKDTDFVFSCVGTNANNPELKLAQESATAVAGALTRLRAAKSGTEPYQPPTVVFVTSSGMSKDPGVHANFPRALHWMAGRVGKYIYLDFERAVAIFKQEKNAWIPVIFFCAPGLMLGPSQGPVRVTNEMPKKAPVYVTYTDLSKAMIMAGQERAAWTGKDVGVVGAKMPPIDYSVMMYYFATGLMCVYVPPLWRIGYRRGWWGTK